MTMSKFKVRFRSGTGHDPEEDPDESDGGPEIREFNTEAERRAFIEGIDLAREMMTGWVDAWIETEIV
jgi:hypothetical protein